MNKREKEVIQSQLDKEKAVMKKLEVQYKRALSDIINKTKILQSDIDALQTVGEADDKTLSMVRSKVYQKQYQQALKQQITGVLDKLHSDEYSTIQGFLNGCYEDGFIGTMYALQGQGIPIIAPIDQSAVVKAVQLDSKVVEGYYKRLGVDFDKLKKVIPQEVSRGIASSLPYTDIARNLNNASKSGLYNAKRIARTEGHRIQQQSAEDARQVAKKKGADVVKQWDASLDSRTRDSHRRVDGEIRENDEKFSNGLMYAGDPNGSAAEVINCRCVTLTRAKWVLDEEELETLKERAEYFGLDKTENFEDYKKKYLTAAKEAAKAEKAASKFVPAKSIEEAERYALKFVDPNRSKWTGNVSFKGLSVESANTINQTLDELFDKYGLPKLRNINPMNFRESKWKDCKDTPLAYSSAQITGELYFNPKIIKDKKSVAAYFAEGERAYRICAENIDKFSGSKRELVERYIVAGRSLVAHDAKDKLAGMLQHEMGHHIQNQIIYHDKTAVQIVNDGFEKFAVKISGYATKTKGEYIAESFCAYMNGESDRIDPALKKYFEGLVM